MEPFEIMVSESQERMLCVVEPARVDAVLARLREVGGRRRPRSATVTDTRPHARARAATSWSATCPCARSSTTARSMTSSRRSPTQPLYPRAARATLGRRRDAARDAARAAGVAEHRLAPAAVRAVRLRSCSRARCAAPSRPTRRCSRCRDGSARSRSRSTATAGASPPTPTAARSRRCSSARRTSPASAPSRSGTTNYLNFGNPEKPHIAWQLTEAVRGLGDACRALGVPIVGGNVSLYNEGADRPDLPDAGGRHGRRAARRRGARAARLRARRATRSRSSAPFAPSLAGSRAGEAARRARCPTGCPRSTSTRSRAAHAAVRDAVRAGALVQRPRHRRGRPRGRARRVLPRRRLGARRDRTAIDGPRRRLFGEGPGGFVVRGARRGARRAARAASSSAPSAATRARRSASVRLDAATSCASARRRRRGAAAGRELTRRAAPDSR